MANPYTTASRDRFFMVPDGAALRAGELELRGLTGESLRVDAADAARFEVPESVVREHEKQRLSTIKEIMRELHDHAVRVVAGIRGISEPAAESSRARVEQILGAVGGNIADLERDPHATLKAAGERLKALAHDKLAAIHKPHG